MKVDELDRFFFPRPPSRPLRSFDSSSYSALPTDDPYSFGNMNTSTANNSGWPTSSGTAPSAGRKHHHRSKRQALKEWKRRPQDRYGFLPEALFQTRKRNMSRKTGKERRTRLLWSYAPGQFTPLQLREVC